MPKRILINGITLEKGNIVPLLLKIKEWQSSGAKITIFSNLYLKNKIDQLDMVGKYDFIELKGTGEIKGKIKFIFEALKRNFIALFYVKRIRSQGFDIVYSISSVLDVILFPYILKKIDINIKWVAIFDNLVPLEGSGNKLVRILAWIFFKISLFFLRKVDYLFTISEDLKKFLIKEEFDSKNIIITGNAVEVDLIKEVKNFSEYKFDALFIGRINEAKGIYDMLKVLDIVKRDYLSFRLAIMGDGDEKTKNKFKQVIKQMGLESNVHFLGYKYGIEKFNIIKSSRCFWFFSESESFGIALLEAVCSGLPSFAYDLPAYKNIYKNNEVFMFEKGDYQSVANKIIAIFDYKQFNNQNGPLLLEKYSWDAIAKIEFDSFKN